MSIISAITKRKNWFNMEIALRSAALRLRSKSRESQRARGRGTDVFLCLVDHYEPQVGKPRRHVAQERVNHWLQCYPGIAEAHRDFDGRVPAHSFFYPWDEYDCWELEQITKLCAAGYGEVDIHLHHRDDDEESLRQKLRDAIRVYRQHGLLSHWPDGRPAWGFIHGNWALANSRCEQGRNLCGVNNEIALLAEEGCYADFTFPAWKHMAQPRKLNSIYYAKGDPNRPKSYDSGQSARVGETQTEGLMLIAGPLVPHVVRRGRSWRIALDDSDLSGSRRYHPSRLDRWVRAGISVQGRPDRVFIKLHSHGADDRNRFCMLDEDLDALFTDCERRYNDGDRFRLHFVSAREMFNIVKATEAGIENITAARDWIIPPPGRFAHACELQLTELRPQ